MSSNKTGYCNACKRVVSLGIDRSISYGVQLTLAAISGGVGWLALSKRQKRVVLRLVSAVSPLMLAAARPALHAQTERLACQLCGCTNVVV